MKNLCKVSIRELLFFYFLLINISLLQLSPSCFAKAIFPSKSTLIHSQLILCHLFCSVRTLYVYLWMHIEQSLSVIYLIYKVYVLLQIIKSLLSLLIYFLLKPMSIKYIVFDLFPVPSSKLSGLMSR